MSLKLLLLLLPCVFGMDFKGQLHCERVFQVVVILFGLVGFIVGYVQQEFRLTFYFLATGGGVSALVCLPDWPWWNRNPPAWREVPDEEDEPKERRKKKKPTAEKEKVTKEKKSA